MSTPLAGILVRPATAADAEALIAHVLAMIEEAPQCLPMGPGEFTMTVEEERAFLEKTAASDNCLYLVAEVNGVIVGALNFTGGKRAALRHAATLGVSVRPAWQGAVGTALLTEAIRRAKTSGVLRRLDLLVYADNLRAIRLYERHGFEREGVRKKAVFRNGEFIDNIEMAMIW
jgi:RimJ/RimL family protein N-acetyltransferase